MDSERWKQVDNLLQSALELPPEKRDAFLRRACAGDKALEREVRSLLSSQQQAGSFLESPAIEVAARAIALKQNKETPVTSGSLAGSRNGSICDLLSACMLGGRVGRRLNVRTFLQLSK